MNRLAYAATFQSIENSDESHLRLAKIMKSKHRPNSVNQEMFKYVLMMKNNVKELVKFLGYNEISGISWVGVRPIEINSQN